jgi:uncharacterized protein (DUF849 family)
MSDVTARSPLIVAVAPNGARLGQVEHPAVPLTPEALAEASEACLAAGAALLHLHVRDHAGGHSLDVGRYREAMEAIRARVGERMVLQVSTEAAGRYGPDTQFALVRSLVPEHVSLAVSELVPDTAAEHDARTFFAWLAGEPVVPQLIVYSAAELERYGALRAGGVIPDAMPHWLLLVLGRHGPPGQGAGPHELLPLLERIDVGVPWAACAFGPHEHACTVAAAAFGGHVRVGFENNTRLRDGSVAPDNAALVAQTAEAAHALGRPLATAADIRALFTGWPRARASRGDGHE